MRGVTKIGLDSAPVIYYTESQSPFYPLCIPFFAAITTGKIAAVTSALTLTETLVLPLRNNDTALATTLRNLLTNTKIVCEPVTLDLAERAAGLRATYNLRTPDAIQLATAIESGCDAFLTNDAGLKRVTEIRVIVVGELTH